MDTVTNTSLLWPLGSWMQEYAGHLHLCFTDNRQMNSRMKNNVFWSGDWKYLESGTHLKCVPPLLPDLGEGLPNDGNIEVIPGHVWFVVDCLKFLIYDSFIMCFYLLVVVVNILSSLIWCLLWWVYFFIVWGFFSFETSPPCFFLTHPFLASWNCRVFFCHELNQFT